jgi:hypothetical protein
MGEWSSWESPLTRHLKNSHTGNFNASLLWIAIPEIAILLCGLSVRWVKCVGFL